MSLTQTRCGVAGGALRVARHCAALSEVPLPIRRPRRIFRSGSLGAGTSSSSLRPTLLAGLLGMAIVALIVLFASSAALFGRVPIPAGEVLAEASQVAVVDGETLRLRDIVVHLRGVAAPARGLACRAPNGTGFDCGTAATEALAALVRGLPIVCRLSGPDRLGFPEARCVAGGTDLNHALVAAGWARARAEGADLAVDEAQARTHRLGLWRSGAVTAPF